MADNTIKIVSESVKDAVGKITSSIHGLGQEIGGKFRDVMSEELTEVLDTSKMLWGKLTGMLQPVLQPFKDLMKTWWKSFLESRLMPRYLKELLGIEKQRRREELAQKGIKAKGFLAQLFEFLMLPLTIVLATLGGLFKKILLPFEMIWKFIKLLPFVKNIKLFDKITDMFRWLETIPGIGWMLKKMKWGFRILGWPLQIFFSLFDFIKGFKETEGNILDKIKGGVTQVLMGFFDLPIQILDWAYNWVAGLFGAEKVNIGEKIRTVFKVFTNILLAPFNWIMGFIEGWKNTEGSIFDKILGGFAGGFDKAFTDVFGSLAQPIKDVFQMAVDFIVGAIDGIKIWIYRFFSESKIAKLIPGAVRESLLSSFGDDIKQKAEAQKNEELAAETEEMRKREEEKLELQRQQVELMRQQLEEEKQKTGKNDLGGGLYVGMSSGDGKAPSTPPPASMPATRHITNEVPMSTGGAF